MVMEMKWKLKEGKEVYKKRMWGKNLWVEIKSQTRGWKSVTPQSGNNPILGSKLFCSIRLRWRMSWKRMRNIPCWWRRNRKVWERLYKVQQWRTLGENGKTKTTNIERINKSEASLFTQTRNWTVYFMSFMHIEQILFAKILADIYI